MLYYLLCLFILFADHGQAFLTSTAGVPRRHAHPPHQPALTRFVKPTMPQKTKPDLLLRHTASTFSQWKNNFVGTKETSGGKPCFETTKLFASFDDTPVVDEDASGSDETICGWPLERSHERAIFLFYGCASTVFLWICRRRSPTTTLSLLAETAIAWQWAAMILAISFLEAWVKFRAPFLRKHVAVDVGRHVFAALNAAELGLCGAFWVGRLLQCCTATSTRATGSFWKSASYYYRDSSFVLPAVTSVLLLAQVFSIAPRLFLRAKARIVEGFNDSSMDAQLSDPEKLALNDISHQVKSSKLPSPKWHRIYALLELVKVVCLQTFAVIQWKSIR